MDNSITFYEYKNNFLGFKTYSNLDRLILKIRFNEQSAQAVNIDKNFSIISLRN